MSNSFKVTWLDSEKPSEMMSEEQLHEKFGGGTDVAPWINALVAAPVMQHSFGFELELVDPSEALAQRVEEYESIEKKAQEAKKLVGDAAVAQLKAISENDLNDEAKVRTKGKSGKKKLNPVQYVLAVATPDLNRLIKDAETHGFPEHITKELERISVERRSAVAKRSSN